MLSGAILGILASRNILFFISILAIFSPTLSYANEALVFNTDRLLKSSALTLERFLGDNFDQYDIAHIDLNGDGADEYITKNKDCSSKEGFCSYNIFGLNNSSVYKLGTLEAHTLMISDQRSYGIRQLIAYQNPINDFDYSIYRWDPAQSRFILFEQTLNAKDKTL